MHVSLIIPCYNEEQNLPAFFAAVTSEFENHGKTTELIFVNDGSADNSMGVLKDLVESYSKTGNPDIEFHVLELSRNFGKEAAMFAGLEHSTGDYIGFIDADLQQDPRTACMMLGFLEEHPDFDCVAAVQSARKESLFLRACKKVYYRTFNRLGETQLLPHSSDFRLFTRQVAEAVLELPEYYRFSKGLFAWIGFNTHVIHYAPESRMNGKSKWPFRKLVSYGWNGILAFSTWPLKLIMICGVILALIALGMLFYDIFEKVAFNYDIPPFQLVLYFVLILGGIQMIVMGVFGEYMARTYIEAKRRPPYILRSEYSSSASKPYEKDS